MNSLRELLEEEEGEKLRVYDDATGKPIVPGSVVVGHPTIGRGRALDTKGISQRESDLLFDVDVPDAIEDAKAVVRSFDSLDEVRQAALVSMAYQMGRAGLRGFRKMLLAVEARNWHAAAREALDSLWAKQTPKRAARVANMLATGLWP